MVQNNKNKVLPLLLILSACSTTHVRRDLANDPARRVFIDPHGIDPANYVAVRRAIVQTGKFEVVDRAEGFQAAILEQELQHNRMGQNFSDKEKWAWMGEFYGAAAVVHATVQCFEKKNFWGTFKRSCKQDMAFIDASTGVVLFEVDGENDMDWTANWVVPDWSEVAQAAVETYPEFFTPRPMGEPLKDYMDQSEERSRRMQETNMQASPRHSGMGSFADDMAFIRQAQKNYLEGK